MRHLIAIILLTTLSTGCSKSKNSSDTRLVGIWEWTSEQPAIYASSISTPQSTGIQEWLLFRSGSKYEIIRNGATVQEGSYTVSASRNYYNMKVREIRFNGRSTGADSSTFYYIDGNKLSFSNDYGGSLGDRIRNYERR